jgi:hypothetical protein
MHVLLYINMLPARILSLLGFYGASNLGRALLRNAQINPRIKLRSTAELGNIKRI